jgi:hypothetical protein
MPRLHWQTFFHKDRPVRKSAALFSGSRLECRPQRNDIRGVPIKRWYSNRCGWPRCVSSNGNRKSGVEPPHSKKSTLECSRLTELSPVAERPFFCPLIGNHKSGVKPPHSKRTCPRGQPVAHNPSTIYHRASHCFNSNVKSRCSGNFLVLRMPQRCSDSRCSSLESSVIPAATAV